MRDESTIRLISLWGTFLLSNHLVSLASNFDLAYCWACRESKLSAKVTASDSCSTVRSIFEKKTWLASNIIGFRSSESASLRTIETFCLILSMLVAETLNITWINTIKLDSWSSGNAFVSGTGSLRCKSRAGQNRQSVANVLQQKLCCPGAMMRIWAPQTRYTLRCNIASIKKKFDECNYRNFGKCGRGNWKR